MTGDTSLSPWSSALTQGWMQWTTGWAEVWDGPLQLSTATLPSFSIPLQILMTRATKADHGSAGRQQGFICSYSAYSRLWSPVGAGDTWGTQDLTTQSIPLVYCSLDSMPKHLFFSFCISLTDTNFSLSQQRKASSLTFTPHLKVKG